MKRFALGIVALFIMSASVGCMWKPFKKPLRLSVDSSDVVIMTKTRTDEGQAISAGEVPSTAAERHKYYKEKLVNDRVVEIPQYWQARGYETRSYNGFWAPAAKIIIVDRDPVTREWSAETNRGTSDKDQGIWVESKDSVGFSTGISITARIANVEDAIVFLNNYPPKTTMQIPNPNGSESDGTANFTYKVTNLKDIIDREVRAKVQGVFADESAAYDMDLLRDKKREIMDVVAHGKPEVKDKDGNVIEKKVVGVVEFFKERGITITQIGMFGGFKYENPKIQEAIDKVFEAQQDKEKAIAETAAAEERKEALKLMGEGEGDKILQQKLKEAEGIKAVADAKKYEIEQAKADLETYLELKRLEVEMQKLKAWDGKLPLYQMQMGDGGKSGAPNVLLGVPAPKK